MGIPLSVARGIRLPGDAWSPRDWALAQAVEVLDRSRCPGCGTPLWLAYDPALERKWRSGAPHRCNPCTALSRAREAWDKHNPEHPGALHFTVEQRP